MEKFLVEKFLAIVSAGALGSLVTMATPESRGTLLTMGRAEDNAHFCGAPRGLQGASAHRSWLSGASAVGSTPQGLKNYPLFLTVVKIEIS